MYVVVVSSGSATICEGLADILCQRPENKESLHHIQNTDFLENALVQALFVQSLHVRNNKLCNDLRRKLFSYYVLSNIETFGECRDSQNTDSGHKHIGGIYALEIDSCNMTLFCTTELLKADFIISYQTG